MLSNCSLEQTRDLECAFTKGITDQIVAALTTPLAKEESHQVQSENYYKNFINNTNLLN